MKRLLTVAIAFSSFLAKGQTPTYNDDIACILYNHCTSCHHEGGIGPFSLMTYDDATAAAYGVMQAVNAGTMPPWPPNHEYNRLAHERLLTEEEIQLITDWVNNGTPEGIGMPPIPPVYNGDEQISNPDLVLTMPQYTISSSGEDVFRCFVIPTNFQEDIYITGLEVVPGNREAVHHVMIYQDQTNLPQQFDDADPEPGYTSFGTTNSESSVPIAGWGPGQGAKAYPYGMGVRVPAGSTIVMQIHYPPTANGQTDQTKMNVLYTTEPIREINIHSFIDHFHLNEGTLTIPANEERTFSGQYSLPLQQDVTLLDVNIHMHLLGKSAKTWAVLPNNQTVPLMEIDQWDFHWQGFYDFQQPIRLPGGTTFYAEATYDNTINNPDNPNNPPETVNVGNDSDEEMMLVLFSYLDYEPGDENIIIDTTSVHPEHNCTHVGVDDATKKANPFNIYPNPVNSTLEFDFPLDKTSSLTILDMTGREVIIQANNNRNKLDVSTLKAGSYFLRINNQDGVAIKRFEKVN